MLLLSLDELLSEKCFKVGDMIPSLEYAKFPTFICYTQ